MRSSLARSLILIMLAALLLSPASARAQAAPDTLPTIDPRIDGIVRGGAWVQGATRGDYRIVILTEGWETIRRLAFVQWIEEPKEPGTAPRVVASRELTPLTDLFALADPVLERVGATWVVTLRGAAMPADDYTVRVRFMLGPPNDVRLAPPR